MRSAVTNRGEGEGHLSFVRSTSVSLRELRIVVSYNRRMITRRSTRSGLDSRPEASYPTMASRVEPRAHSRNLRRSAIPAREYRSATFAAIDVTARMS